MDPVSAVTVWIEFFLTCTAVFILLVESSVADS
jgi:hypothetical protein